MFYDGPWQASDALRKKFNAYPALQRGARAGQRARHHRAGCTNSWHSTTRSGARVSDGSLSRFGAVDQTDGGDTQRYSLSLRWSRTDDRGASLVEAYGIYSTLNLFNNFTYFLDNPDLGDQFQRSGQAQAAGPQREPVVPSQARRLPFGDHGRHADPLRRHRRGPVQHLPAQPAYNTVRYDQVGETSVGLYLQNTTAWADWLRVTLGVRGDLFMASVGSTTCRQLGHTSAFLASPKAGVVFGPFEKTEFYLNGGFGYHSNDARGATITVNPADPISLSPRCRCWCSPRRRDRRAQPGDQGLGHLAAPSSCSTSIPSLCSLGDAGTRRPAAASRRIGVEWTN